MLIKNFEQDSNNENKEEDNTKTINKKSVLSVDKPTLKEKTLTGLAKHMQVLIQQILMSGGVVANTEKTHRAVFLLNIFLKKKIKKMK